MSVLQKDDAALLGDAGEIDLREFRTKRSNIPLYVLGAVIVPVALAVYFGGIDAWVGAVAAVISVPSTIAFYLRKRRLRILLGAPGYFITDESSKSVVLWDDVLSAVVVTDEGHMVLRLADGSVIRIPYASYEDSDDLRRAVESHLAGRISVEHVRSNAAKAPAALLIVVAGITAIGFIFLASFGPDGSVLAAGVGVAVGAGVGVVLLRRPAARQRSTVIVRALLIGYVSILAVFVLYSVLVFLLRHRFDTRSAWPAAALLFGYALGLFLVPLIVRAIRIEKRVRDVLRRRPPADLSEEGGGNVRPTA